MAGLGVQLDSRISAGSWFSLAGLCLNIFCLNYRPGRFSSDLQKLNTLQIIGWFVFPAEILSLGHPEWRQAVRGHLSAKQ